jgi:hypothetical protein
VEGAVSELALSERVERLERTARRDRALALGALALVLATAQTPAATPLVVRDAAGNKATLSASGLVVRNGAGAPRSALGFDKDRNPSLDEYDSSGAIRQSMYLLTNRPVFRQFDKAGNRRAEMFLAADTQNGEFVIRDANGVTRAAVFIGDKGLPEAGFYAGDGNVRAYLSADDAAPYMVMKDRSGVFRVIVGGFASGGVGIEVRNAAGTAVWSKP